TVGKKTADIKGEKIDTAPTNEDEKEQQEDAINEINNFNEDLPDTSGDESESKEEESEDEKSEEETDEEEDEESKDKKSEEESDEKSEEESDESKEEESEKSDEEGLEQDSRPEWEREGFKTAEEYIAHLKNEKATPPEDDNLNEPEKQKQTIFDLIDKHKDILPVAMKDNYEKFYTTNNTAFLHMDDHLHKLVSALDKINDKLPFKERVEAAFTLAFRDKIDKISQKRGEVKAEIRTQKVNKSAGTSVKSGSEKSSGKSFTPEQLEIAKKMDIKLT
ncbi:MAG: hypothetical protein WCW93_03755, partial [Candidatus Paceibacterota bacterium]